MRYSLFALAAASTALASPHMHRRGHGAHAGLFGRQAYGYAPEAPAVPVPVGTGGLPFPPVASSAAPAESCGCTTYVTTRTYAVTYSAEPTAPGGGDSTVTVVPVYESDASSTPCTTETVPATATETSVTYVDALPSGVPSGVPSAGVPVGVPSGAPEVPDVDVPVPSLSTFTNPGTYTIPASTITLSSTITTCVPAETVVPSGTQTYGGVTTEVAVPTTLTVPIATVETTDGVTTSKVTSTVYVCPTPGTYTIAPSTTVVDADTPVTYPVPTEIAPGTYTHPEQIVTITRTSQVVTCPWETTVPTAPAEAPVVVPTSAPAPPAPEAPAPEAPAPEAPAPEAPAPDTEVDTPSLPDIEIPVPTVPKPTVPKPTLPVVPKPGTGNGPWSISYSPYEDNGNCRSPEGVMSDIGKIAAKGFKNVRVYGTECDTLQNVGSACAAHGLKMIVGVFFHGSLSSGDAQVQDIIRWGRWDLIEMIVIGNEAVFKGETSLSGLAGYIAGAKAQITAAGYNGVFTTAETLGVLQQNDVGALCSVVDVVGVNIQVFFDGGRSAWEAGEFFKSQVEDAKKVCPGKEVFVLEAGWPSAGQSIGAAVAGKVEQKIAIKAMNEAAPGHVSFFTFKNDYWKAPADNIEANFGCFDLF